MRIKSTPTQANSYRQVRNEKRMACCNEFENKIRNFYAHMGR